MWTKWLAKIKKKLFALDINYRINYVVENINRLTLDDMVNLKIDLLTQYKTYDRLNLNMLNKAIDIIYHHLDEDTYNPITIKHTVIISNAKQMTLMELIDNGDGTISNMYKDNLKYFINRVRQCRELLVDLDIKNDIDLSFNSSVLNTYIITMEKLVNSLYVRLAI